MELKVLDSYAAGFGTQRRYDDVTLSVFAENELKQIIPKLYDRLYRELDAKEHIPIGVDVNPGAMAWAYDSFDGRGQAEFIGAGTTDVPRADVSKQRFTFPVRSIALGYGWSIEEMMAAKFAGVPLDIKKAERVRRGIAEKEHTTLISGFSQLEIPGFLTNTTIPLITVPNGNWFGGATADQMVEDMDTVVDAVWVGTNKVHRPNTLLLPLAHYRRAVMTRIPNTSISVLKYFMDNNVFIQEVKPFIEMATAGPTSGPRMLAYDKSPENLSGVIPLPFTQLDPQVRGLEVFIPSWERLGGTVWFYPFAGCFGDGI